MGVVVGDALGLPVQFKSREELAEEPLSDMIGHGTFDMPPGTWSDDSSLTLATLASIKECWEVNCEDIMDRFVDWLDNGAYTPSVFLLMRDLHVLGRFTNSRKYVMLIPAV